MLFRKRKEQEQERREGIQIGDRFAIQYGAISTPVYYEDEHPYTSAKIKTNYHDLGMGEISECWTVLEYIGDKQFIDLITGEIIVYQTDIDFILDTVTIEYEQKALAKQQELLENPLALGNYDGFHFHGITQLTPNLKKIIIEESMPRQEEIISTIQKKKQEARKLISTMYERKNRGKMHKLYNEAAKENERRNAELARQKREEERKRQEEERRLAQERLSAQVDPQFNLLFPQGKAKTLIKRKK